ncbi:MAG: type II secretion system F family protein [Desulfobacteraceae bacterium]|jgi:tight adherence protein B
MSVLLLGLVVFIQVLLVFELAAYAYRIIKYPDRAQIRKRMKQSMALTVEVEPHDIIKKKIYSDIPLLNKILAGLPWGKRLDLLMYRANVKYTMGYFILISAALGFTAYLISYILIKNPLFAAAIAMAAAGVPFISLRAKKRKRTARFEKQLPEGLELIARALKAGHAFTNGMKLASEEFPDPLGPEFEDTLDEINFGLSVPDALKNLSRRVDCPDLSYFVVAVILQRETGGNLSEIIENLAHLIRERFKFRGKVRILSAEGRMTGKILVAVPAIVFLAIYWLNPEHVGMFIADPMGQTMLGAALVLLCIGALVIKRILKLDV